MKIAEYNQMMAYLTRPEPVILPQPKPQELIDIQEQKRIEREKKTFEEASPFLMEESVDFIEREEFSAGGITLTEVNKYRKQGLRAQDIIEKLSESLNRNVTLTEYEKFLTTNKAKLVPVSAQKLTKEQIKAYDKATKKITKGKFKKFSDLDPKKDRKLKVLIAQEGTRRLKGVAEGSGGPGVFKDIVEGEETLSKSIRNILDDADKPLNLADIRKELESKNISFNKNNLESTVQRLRKTKDYKNKIVKIPGADTVQKLRNIAFEKRKPFIQAIRDAFVANPDATPEEIAEAMYGTKNFKNATSAQKIDYLKEMSRNVEQFVEVYGNPKTFKPVTKDLKAIPVEKLGDILDNIAKNASAFGYGQNAVINLQFQIADAARNFPPRTSMRLRESLQKKNFEVDEVVGRAATYQRAPGYIEATQVIPKKANQLKGQRLDNKFSKVFGEALEGNYKNVEEYNTFAKKFGKKNKIDVPIIKIGSNLNPKDYITYFNEFSPAAQKNITDIAKNKNLVVETKSKPLFSLTKGQKKLTALQKIMQGGKTSGVDPVLLTKAGYEEFVKPTGKFAGQIAKGVGRSALTAADFALSAGKGATGLGLGLLLEADPIITGMSEGKTFGQTARDTFIGTAIDLIPGVNLGSLNEDLIKLANTDQEKLAVQNLIDYQRDYKRFNKDLNAFKSYVQLNQVELEELGLNAGDLVNMESKLAKRFKEIQTRAPIAYDSDAIELVKGLARKEAIRRKENLETGIAGKIFGDRMAKDPNFIDDKIQQILAASTGQKGATDSYTDNYRLIETPKMSPQELDDIYEMGGIMGAAEGGRIGFADGPMDPKRRLFLKLMGGIASLPFMSKFFGKSEVVKPVVKVAGSSTKMPDWFPDLINKVMFSGTGKRIDADLTLYEPKELPGISIGRYDDGRVFVEGKNAYGKTYKIEYEPPGYELIDETTGKAAKKQGEFIAEEEVPVNIDRDGNPDFDVEVLDDLDQILGPDTASMEKYATGKVTKTVKDFTGDSGMKTGEYNVGAAEARAEQAAEEAAETLAEQADEAAGALDEID